MYEAKTRDNSEMSKAIQQLLKEVRGGLDHGHFKCEITCELQNGRKRALTIACGRSYRFVIPEEELKD